MRLHTDFMKAAFTLIEMIIVMVIIATLALLLTGGYTNSLKTARDARRKSDLVNMQKALEMYYSDKRIYPVNNGAEVTSVLGNRFCENSPGACGATQVYMQTIPGDPLTNYRYWYVSPDGSYFKLYSCIENLNVTGPGVNYSGPYAGTNCGSGCANGCRFGVASLNTSP